MVKYFCDICKEEMNISQSYSVDIGRTTQNILGPFHTQYKEICECCRNRIVTQINLLKK